MTTARRTLLAATTSLALCAVLVWGSRPEGVRATDLPASLSDAEFWRLSSSFSETGGTFHSDNFVSNEALFQRVIPELVARVRPGGVYLGVGPEQNFTYIAAVQPRIAFIVDIRRGNLHEHLLYKALFELSANRAEFLGRLFSRAVPEGLARDASASALFAAFDRQPTTEARYQQGLAAVIGHLTKTRGLPLDAEDIDGIDYVYRTAFFADGPDLNYRLTGQQRGRGGVGNLPTYADLMSLEDGQGGQRSFLADEGRFRVVKALEEKNLIVPVVGDFGGPKALRSVGGYVRDNGGLVSTFYLSNVEQYLRQDGKWEAFCANVATLPLDDTSTFIRSVRGGGGGRGFGGGAMFQSMLGLMRAETRGCAVR